MYIEKDGILPLLTGGSWSATIIGGGQLTKSVHEGEKHIPAPKAVVLYHRKGIKDPPGPPGRRG